MPVFVGGTVNVGAGYPIGKLGGGTVMLGVEGSGMWLRGDEDGDEGTYSYRIRVLGAHLVLGFRR